MPLPLITEKTTGNSLIEHTSDSLLTNTYTPTSVRRTANDSRKSTILIPHTWNDESKPFTTTVASKAVSPCLRSATPFNHCLDGSTVIPFMLDSKTEDQLSACMLTKYEELLPTKESYYRRTSLVQKVELLLNTEWPDKDIKAILFGSSVNDLGTSQSDVDICITTQWSGLRNVGTLAKLFIRCGMQQVVCVPRAQVPIVRLFDPETQLACDININSTMALHNTKMIRTYIAIDPRVRPLTMIIKHWVKQRKLNDAADGGTLSTYTWTCMIINFLQMRQPPILPVLHQMKNTNSTDEMFYSDIDTLQGFGQANCESLGGLLFAFFRRYSIEFDYDDQVVSVRHGRYLTKHEKGWHFGRNKSTLCVEEPFNVGRNLGNSADTRSVRGIRMELNRALEMMLAGVTWHSICSPYRPLTCGTLAPVYGTSNKHYSAVLPQDEARGINITATAAASPLSSYHGGNHGNKDNSPPSTMEWTTPPLSLSLSSTSTSSSSSLSPPSFSPPSPPSPSSPSPSPPISLSPNQQPLHRSPDQQQKIIDAITAKYLILYNMVPEQHPDRRGQFHHQHTTHRQTRQNQSSHWTGKRKEPPSISQRLCNNNHTDSTIEYPATTLHHPPKLTTTTTTTTTSHRKSKKSQHYRRRRSRSETKTHEPIHSLESLAPHPGPTSPYTIEIKLPPSLVCTHLSLAYS